MDFIPSFGPGAVNVKAAYLRARDPRSASRLFRLASQTNDQGRQQSNDGNEPVWEWVSRAFRLQQCMFEKTLEGYEPVGVITERHAVNRRT